MEGSTQTLPHRKGLSLSSNTSVVEDLGIISIVRHVYMLCHNLTYIDCALAEIKGLFKTGAEFRIQKENLING